MTAYTDAVLADSPVVFWQLNEASGTTITDSSGNGNDGTLTGTVAYQDTELWSGMDVITFGSGDYVEIDTPIALPASWTIEAWAIRDNSTISGNYFAVVAGDEPFTDNFAGLRQQVGAIFTNDDGQFSVVGCGPVTSVGTDTVYPDYTQPAEDDPTVNPKAVHHYAIVADNSLRTLTFYIDGVSVGSESISPESFQTFATFTLRVASDGAGSGHWIGGIGNVAFYNTALSSARIYAHYLARPHDWTSTESATATDTSAGDLAFVETDTFTATDEDGALEVELTDTDSGSFTEATILGLFATDSATAGDYFSGGRVDPNITTNDTFTATDTASMTSTATGAWTPEAPYDVIIDYPIFDFTDPRVITTTTSDLPADDDMMFDAIITYDIFDFTVADWANA